MYKLQTEVNPAITEDPVLPVGRTTHFSPVVSVDLSPDHREKSCKKDEQQNDAIREPFDLLFKYYAGSQLLLSLLTEKFMLVLVVNIDISNVLMPLHVEALPLEEKVHDIGAQELAVPQVENRRVNPIIAAV